MSDAEPLTTKSDLSLPHWLRWLEPYLRPEMAGMLLLGFASGLPLYLVYQKTSYWLRLEGIERSTIGYFYWVGMFYSFKFLWAPIIDRTKIPLLGTATGHRRSWMIVSILGTVVGLLTIASSDPSQSLLTVTIGALLLAFSGATLDVSIDAWRIESAPTERQANMAASYSLGYRGALIFSGLGLVVADFANWNISFAFMALAMALCAGLVLLIREPAHRQKKPLDNLPLLAGPPNAIAVGVGLIVAARIALMVGLPGIISGIFAVFGVLVLLAGPLLFPATKTALMYRLTFAVLGAIFVFSRIGWLSLFDFTDESRWLSLAVLLTTLTVMVLFVLVLLQSRKTAGSGAGLLAKDGEEPPRGKLYELFVRPLMQVIDRYGLKVFVPVLILVMIYRLSDFTMGVMASPLYADLGYAPSLVGSIQSVPGVLAIIFGLFLGGLAVQFFGLMRSMIAGGLVTLVTNAAYAWFSVVAAADPQAWMLFSAICADNIAGGFVTTVFIAYLSSLVDPAFAATQYALFSSLYAFLNKFIAGFSGLLADAVGYFSFFLITASYAIPGIFLILIVMHLQKKYPPRPFAEAAGSSGDTS